MELTFGNPLPSKLDHGRRNVNTNDPIPGISEFFCPNPTATTEVHDKPLGDVVLPEQPQEARCRASGKRTETAVMDIGQIVLVSIGVDHGYLARLPCCPLQNGQKGQSSPCGKSSPSSCGQPMLP